MSEQNNPEKIEVGCPYCDYTAMVPIKYAGKKVKCADKACRMTFELPTVEEMLTIVERQLAEEEFSLEESFEANPYMQQEDETLQPNETTHYVQAFASNPGNLSFNILQWWKYNPLSISLGITGLISSLALWGGLVAAGYRGTIPTKNGGETPIWLFGPACLLTAVFFSAVNFRKFGKGDANPGVVISLDPVLIAVPTDLTQGIGEFPVLKIVRIKLKQINGKPIKLGDCVPTVANYADTAPKDCGHWGDFYPDPAQYATSDQKQIHRLLNSFPQEQFDFIEEALKLIEPPYEEGLYALWSTDEKPAGRKINKPADF